MYDVDKRHRRSRYQTFRYERLLLLLTLIMAAMCNRAGHYIFAMRFLLLLSPFTQIRFFISLL